MGLNKKGIRELATALVRNQEFYNQDTFPVPGEECGSVGCQAGMCYRLSVTDRTYKRNVKKWWHPNDGMDRCLLYGLKKLGLEWVSTHARDLPQIFQPVSLWPSDLRNQYESDGPRWRVIAAVKALQRLLPDGTIDPDRNAVHTPLKAQLKKLLEAKEKSAA